MKLSNIKKNVNFVIYQVDRILLRKYMIEFGHYVRGKMLDIGAGDVDRYTKWFKYSERVTTDIQAGANVDVVASAENLPFNDSEFDSVVCTQVLEHVPNPWPVVAEIYRVLKSGGHALVSVPLTAEIHEEPHDYWRYTRYGLQELFTKNNFEVVELKQEGGYYSLVAHQRIKHLIYRYNFYERPLLGRFSSKLFRLYGSWMILKDERSVREFNKKFTLGYVMVVKKV